MLIIHLHLQKGFSGRAKVKIAMSVAMLICYSSCQRGKKYHRYLAGCTQYTCDTNFSRELGQAGRLLKFSYAKLLEYFVKSAAVKSIYVKTLKINIQRAARSLVTTNTTLNQTLSAKQRCRPAN